MQPVSAASAPAVPPLGTSAAHPPPLGSVAAPGAGMVQHSTANYSQQVKIYNNILRNGWIGLKDGTFKI